MNCRQNMRHGLMFAAALAAAMIPLVARADAGSLQYELLIERSPVQAGDVTPNSGTHRFSANSEVPLRAEAQPGYQFAYWLGDVLDPTAERTTITLNEPKVVVAVFQPEPQKRLQHELRSGGGGGGDALLPTAVDLSSPGWSPAGGSGGSKTAPVYYVVPIPTPEPTTIILLSVGMLVLRRTRR